MSRKNRHNAPSAQKAERVIAEPEAAPVRDSSESLNLGGSEESVMFVDAPALTAAEAVETSDAVKTAEDVRELLTFADLWAAYKAGKSVELCAVGAFNGGRVGRLWVTREPQKFAISEVFNASRSAVDALLTHPDVSIRIVD